MLLTAMLCGCTILVVATEFMVVGLAPYLSDALALSPTDYSLVLSSFAIASAIAGPLLLALGLGVGAVHDMAAGELGEQVRDFVDTVERRITEATA